MGDLKVPPQEVIEAVEPRQTRRKYELYLKDGQLRDGHSRSQAQTGKLLEREDRLTVTLEKGDGLYFYNPDPNDTVTVEVEKTGLIHVFQTKARQFITSIGDLEQIGGVAQSGVDMANLAKEAVQTTIRDRLTTIRDTSTNEDSATAVSATDDTTGSTLPSTAVPAGKAVQVKAPNSNSSPVDLFGTYALRPGEVGPAYNVTNTDAIQFTARSSGDELQATVEQ